MVGPANDSTWHRATCEACGEQRCGDCGEWAKYRQHRICGECRQRGVEECAACGRVDALTVKLCRYCSADYMEEDKS